MLTGKFEDLEILAGGLPYEYLNFLKSFDQISKWEEIQPLPKPLSVDKKYSPVPDDVILKLQNLAPSLCCTYPMVQWSNELSCNLGIRYAFARLHIHAHLLNAVDMVMREALGDISSIIEVGCFNGGLLHFLADQYAPLQTIGIDLSPIALDLASDLSDEIETNPKTLWLETNFALLENANLGDGLENFFKHPIIILCNVIGEVGRELGRSPAVDEYHAQAGLISYWVNQGAAVLVLQRNDTPEEHLEELVDKGRWVGDHCVAKPLEFFECWSTENMTEENPLGEWIYCKAGTFLFYNKKSWPFS